MKPPGTPPILGWHRSVRYAGHRLGGVVELRPDTHVSVCGDCHQPLAPRTTRALSEGLLLTHWQLEHGLKVAKS